MAARFQHLEVLGPRADLDRWLAGLQDLGVCHVADAMHGLEGQPRVGRPIPSAAETRAQRIRSEAGRALRAVAHVLPLSPSRLPADPTPDEQRPDWMLAFEGGAPETDLLALRDEACEIAGALRDALHRVAACEHDTRQVEGGSDAPPADRERVRAAERDARAALQDVLGLRGARARHLLDSLDDADQRQALHDRLASTEHVVAARIYVRPEDEAPLRTALAKSFGDHVVVRPLDDADDMPTLPKRLAPYPFAVLASLQPSRLGEVGLASVLALAAPLVTACLWADIAGGLLLIAVGAVLGAGAGPGSPRRDTAVLAQLSGLVALIMGVCVGRMFGPAGFAWFGSGWGLLDVTWSDGGFRDVAFGLGLVAGILALHALVALWRAQSTGMVGRRHQAAGFALSAVAACALAVTPSVPWMGLVALLAAVAFGYTRGLRALFFQFGLDLVGFVRLAAVGTAAIFIAATTFGGWIAPHFAAIVLTPITLGVAVLAMVADPAYVAMGVPYDVALGGRQLSHPFVPFTRSLRGSGGDR